MTKKSIILPEQDKKVLRQYRRRLGLLMLISSGIDIAIFTLETPLLIPFWGSSLVVDELVEFFISKLLAKNKLELKKRYKIAGLLPIPGVTSLSIQAMIEMVRTWRNPGKIIEKMQSAD